MTGPFFRLGDVCVKIGSGATPRGGSDVYLDRGTVSLIRSQNVLLNEFTREGRVYLSDHHAAELSNVEICSGDVLLNITGDSVARCCQVPDDVLPARVNQHVAIIRPKRGELDARYLRYFLVSPTMQQHMLGLAGAGATRNALTKGMIEAFQVPRRQFEEQCRIADILGSFDDKIELNRRTNETLEAMARTLFRSWFVDFDPVRIKVDGQQPQGMDAATAALFPDSFEPSALGSIPKGWRVGQLTDALAELETGNRPKGGVAGITSGVPSIGAESIDGLGVFDFSKTKFVPQAFFDSMGRGHVRSRDVLLYKDGGRPGMFEPHVAMFGDGFPFSVCSINEHVYRLRANDQLSQAFLYFWLSGELTLAEMRVKGTGVAVPGLNSTAVRSLKVLLPSREVVAAFDRFADSLISAILRNANEQVTLAALRDALLPKLLSGEVRPDHEEPLEIAS